MKTHNFVTSNAIGKVAVVMVEKYLENLPGTSEVRNVEDLKEYRIKDIDLVWKNGTKSFTIEVKGDTYHKTGNFFFETVSNIQKNTPGCFMYTEADYIFYTFPILRVAYVLPTERTRAWFKRNKRRFQHVKTSTGKGADVQYTSEGAKVPIKEVLSAVKVKVVSL